MIIRHATLDDLEEITKLEAKCFPAAEAAGSEAFFDRLASFPDHFWLLYEDEKRDFSHVRFTNCLPHSRYFSDELGGQIFAKLSN